LPTIGLQLAERLNILYRQVHNKRAHPPLPTIAVDAADEPLTITVNLDHGLVAAGAFHIIDFS
jgi:hypothetical protein